MSLFPFLVPLPVRASSPDYGISLLERAHKIFTVEFGPSDEWTAVSGWQLGRALVLAGTGGLLCVLARVFYSFVFVPLFESWFMWFSVYSCLLDC